ncbi:MAG: hypothetical protein QY332_09550 [Anaerolineales bacterium]|nr:MAG: hypothetical protein QY332_09550 [Anaerolineales bacterium]
MILNRLTVCVTVPEPFGFAQDKLREWDIVPEGDREHGAGAEMVTCHITAYGRTWVKIG